MRQQLPSNPRRELQNDTTLITLKSFHVLIESSVPISDFDLTEAASEWMNRLYGLEFPDFLSVVLGIDGNKRLRKLETQESVYFLQGAAIFRGSDSVTESEVLAFQSEILEDEDVRLLQYLQLITKNITSAEASLDPLVPSGNNSTLPTPSPSPVTVPSPTIPVVELLNLTPFTVYMTVGNATNVEDAIVLQAATQWLEESFPLYLQNASLVDGYAVFNTCFLTIDKSGRRFLQVEYQQRFQGGAVFSRTAVNSQMLTLQNVQNVQETIFEMGTNDFLEILQQDFGVDEIYNLTVASTNSDATEVPVVSNAPAPSINGTINPTTSPLSNVTGSPVAPIVGTNSPNAVTPVPVANFTFTPNASLAPSNSPGSAPTAVPKPAPANVSGAKLPSVWFLPTLLLIQIVRWFKEGL
jgi:hypothetical protein